ncbi:unnamed protein product [Fusarium graminearum]|uniref:Uncharacterized protein n=1 Tax=Gibberella zeae TaxID=5518 RepID=A0A4E9ENJ0_GIBZA|nr:unnamed protein product [Fusarium graminearum]
MEYNNYPNGSNIPNAPTTNRFAKGEAYTDLRTQAGCQLYDQNAYNRLWVDEVSANGDFSMTRPAYSLSEEEQQKRLGDDIFQSENAREVTELCVRWDEFMKSIKEEERTSLFYDIKRYFTSVSTITRCSSVDIEKGKQKATPAGTATVTQGYSSQRFF